MAIEYKRTEGRRQPGSLCQGVLYTFQRETIAINLYPFLTFTKLMGIERDFLFLFAPKLLPVVVVLLFCYRLWSMAGYFREDIVFNSTRYSRCGYVV